MREAIRYALQAFAHHATHHLLKYCRALSNLELLIAPTWGVEIEIEV